MRRWMSFCLVLLLAALFVGLGARSTAGEAVSDDSESRTAAVPAEPTLSPSDVYGGGMGELSDAAAAALDDSANDGKWIGMVRGEDGLLHVDMITDTLPSPGEQSELARTWQLRNPR